VARPLPPLNALRAFEAAARSESFTKAAAELSVTQGAVSQQVKALETELGLKLFLRQHHQLVLTEPGRQYIAVVSDALHRIALGTEQLRNQSSANVLTVSTSPDFAAKWLVHRLDSFAQACPDIDLRISASMHHVDFAAENIDVAVRHGTGNWDNMLAEKLCVEELFVICAPKFTASISKPQDILKHTLLHTDPLKDWDVWLTAAGVDAAKMQRGPVFNRASLAIDAAIDGQGLALSRTTLAAWDLLKGRLAAPLAIRLPLSKTYWIVSPQSTSKTAKIRKFRDWIRTSAEEDLSLLRSMDVISG
jgi:LysR family transcriptional regulator, glycine cleavage system transcriptional activator